MATQAYGVLSLLVPELATVGCQPAGFVSGIPGGTSHMPEHEQDLFKKKKKRILLRQGWDLCCGPLTMGVVSEVLVWSACPWGSCVMWFWNAGPKSGWVGRSWGRGAPFLLSAALTVQSWKGRPPLHLSELRLPAVQTTAGCEGKPASC